jgi:glycosyltransferase involved in cell wall biosynthesis
VTPDVSVVVPTRKRPALLERLLRALDQQTHPNYEVVVIDDWSRDETGHVLNAWSGGSARRRCMMFADSRGSYAARNAGWRWAEAPLIAFTDDDCIPEPTWLDALVAAMPETGAVGVQGKTVVRDGVVTPFTHQIEQLHGGPPYRTCNMLYTRVELERQGGFDDSFRWYADNIFGLRARLVGTIPFAAEAVVVHPPRPREWRSRADWLARFHADARHRAILRELGEERADAGRTLLPLVLWVARPLVKQSRAHAAFALAHPMAYLRGAAPMAGERVAMLMALADYWRGELDEPLARPDRSVRPLLTPSPTLSVIIVSRDRPELLNDALRWVKPTGPIFEIVVVDNGDGSAHAVAEGHGVRVVDAPGVTLGAARQVGFQQSTGHIVAFTDDDCLPESGWAHHLNQALRAHPEWSGVQGRTDPGAGPVDRHTVSVQRPHRLFHTCNIAYRRTALQTAGGFDPRFRGWFEDTAAGARALTVGPIGWAGDAVVTHRAMPRIPLTQTRWTDLIHDEYLLYDEYRSFYRRVRGPHPLVVLIFRWLVGSALKQIAAALPRAHEDPQAFQRLLRILAIERIALLRVLFDSASVTRESGRRRRRAGRRRGTRRREP